jgi:hypothetical protein
MVLANPSKGFVVDIFLSCSEDTSSNLVEPIRRQEVLSAPCLFVLSLKGILGDTGVFFGSFQSVPSGKQEANVANPLEGLLALPLSVRGITQVY